MLFVLFILASVFTFFAASRLARYGDAIASTTGLGKGLVGLVLLSSVTSLPELASSMSASFIGNVDLSFGNIFGSNMTNIFIVVIMDLFIVGTPILLYAGRKNVMIGSTVIFVSSIALMMLLIAGALPFQDIDFWFLSPILFLSYLLAMYILYKYEKGLLSESSSSSSFSSSSVSVAIAKKKAIFGFVISSIVVLLAAFLLSYSLDLISELKIGSRSLGGTFVGTLFMAFTTSLPEVVVSITAIRMSNYDMALGNLFGSNLFNLAILSLSDVFYRLGAISREESIVDDAFSMASTNHIISGVIGIIFVAVVLASLMLRRETKKGILGLDTVIIATFYLLGFYLLFVLR